MQMIQSTATQLCTVIIIINSQDQPSEGKLRGCINYYIQGTSKQRITKILPLFSTSDIYYKIRNPSSISIIGQLGKNPSRLYIRIGANPISARYVITARENSISSGIHIAIRERDKKTKRAAAAAAVSLLEKA